MGYQTLLLLTSFLITSCACVKSCLKLIETSHKYYSERMRRALSFGLVYVILVSNKNIDILNMISGI